MNKNITDNNIFVKPAAGITVIDPLTAKPIAAEGAFVPNSKYWRRRLADGDIAYATMPGSTVKKQTSKKKED